MPYLCPSYSRQVGQRPTHTIRSMSCSHRAAQRLMGMIPSVPSTMAQLGCVCIGDTSPRVLQQTASEHAFTNAISQLAQWLESCSAVTVAHLLLLMRRSMDTTTCSSGATGFQATVAVWPTMSMTIGVTGVQGALGLTSSR
jgi:hypothetical protein